jgi:hypothetical protein
MPTDSSDLERLLGRDYLDGIEDRSIDEVRQCRAQLDEAEVAVSYIRRMVQGRLDIVVAEHERRRTGKPARLVSDLVNDLPGILSEGGRGGGPGRLTTFIDPGTGADQSLLDELDHIADATALNSLADATDQELEGLRGSLETLERQVSERRRTLHERLDAIHGELVRRYRSGEADVDTLLR